MNIKKLSMLLLLTIFCTIGLGYYFIKPGYSSYNLPWDYKGRVVNYFEPASTIALNKARYYLSYAESNLYWKMDELTNSNNPFNYIKIKSRSRVYVTFLKSNSSKRNGLGFYVTRNNGHNKVEPYESNIGLIFPNTTQLDKPDGHTDMTAAVFNIDRPLNRDSSYEMDVVCIGDFEKNDRIWWTLYENAFLFNNNNPSIGNFNSGSTHYYSNSFINPDSYNGYKARHFVTAYTAIDNPFTYQYFVANFNSLRGFYNMNYYSTKFRNYVFAVEDTNHNYGYPDYNDVIYLVTVVPYDGGSETIDEGEVDLDNHIAGTFVTRDMFRDSRGLRQNNTPIDHSIAITEPGQHKNVLLGGIAIFADCYVDINISVNKDYSLGNNLENIIEQLYVHQYDDFPSLIPKKIPGIIDNYYSFQPGYGQYTINDAIPYGSYYLVQDSRNVNIYNLAGSDSTETKGPEFGIFADLEVPISLNSGSGIFVLDITISPSTKQCF